MRVTVGASLAAFSLVAAARLPAVPAQIFPTGPELQVNTFTNPGAESPAVALDADGDVVVVWESERDGHFNGVFGRRHSSDGSAAGSEFQVNTYTYLRQEQPAVGAAADGSFVVVWASQSQDAFAGDGVFAQRYASDGSPVSSEFQVNTLTQGLQQAPAVAVDADGDFMVAWESLNPAMNEIVAQRFASSGAPVGTEFQVNTYTVGSQYGVALATDADGDGVATWTSFNQDGFLDGVFAQRFASNGSLIGTEFQVSTYTIHHQFAPVAAAAATGDFVIAWVSYEQDGSSSGVFAQRYASNGTALGTEFQVNQYTRDYQEGPSVAAADNGDFIIGFVGFRRQEPHVFARRYDSGGTPLGPEFRVSGPSFDEATGVASDSDGNFILAWSTYFSREDILAQRFSLTAPGCPASPLSGCSAPGRSLVRISDDNADGAGPGDKLAWKWLRGPATAKEDFGFPPANANHLFCVYAGAASTLAMQAVAPAGGVCDGRDCWKEIGSRGFKRNDPAAAGDGLRRVSLKGGAAGRAKIDVKGEDGGLDLTPTTLPFDPGSDVIVQLSTNANDNCWEATFPPAAVDTNSDRRFEAEIP